MRILIYSLNFSPELTGIGKYSGEMSEWLVMHGYDVRVVTAFPYYPSWMVDSNYVGKLWHVEQKSGMKIYRCPLWVPSIPSGFARLLLLASFAMSSIPVLFIQLFWRPRIIWVVQPAFFCAPIALVTAWLCRAKTWLHIQDFEIDAAFSMGILKGKFLLRTMNYLETFLMCRFNIVSSISSKMNDRILEKNVSALHVRKFVNWVDIDFFNQKRLESEFQSLGIIQANSQCCKNEQLDFRNMLDIPADSIVALYSGNMGKKQGLNILAEVSSFCFNSLKSDPLHKIIFVFCGGGSGRLELKALCGELKNVRFLDLQPLNRLPNLLMMADIHLLPQIENAADLVMPSKLSGILASARSVIVTANQGTELASIVGEFGVVIPPNNLNAFIEALRSLVDDPLHRINLGILGYKYAQKHLDKNVVLGQFKKDIESIVQNNSN